MDLKAIDCLDIEKTRELFSSLKFPAAGVFFLAVQLKDRLFTQLLHEDDWKAGRIWVGLIEL